MTSDRFALQAWDKAEVLLAEALAQQPESSPAAIVHSGYYAVFHAARAVLLSVAGSAPKKQSGVIEQFGLLVRDLSPELREAGRDLNRMEKSRILADCDETRLPSAEDARDAVHRAQTFLQLCLREFGFPRRETSHG